MQIKLILTEFRFRSHNPISPVKHDFATALIYWRGWFVDIDGDLLVVSQPGWLKALCLVKVCLSSGTGVPPFVNPNPLVRVVADHSLDDAIEFGRIHFDITLEVPGHFEFH